MTVALDIKNVSHSFGDFLALDDVSLQINPGDFTVLLGLNGAGKTTLYSLITRLYNNNSGSIKIYGFDVRRCQKCSKKHWCSFSTTNFGFRLSVKEKIFNIIHPLHGISYF